MSPCRNGTNGHVGLDATDELLLRHLHTSRCHLRLSELVNENRDHDLTANELLERLDRLQHLGLVAPAYWEITDAGKEAIGSSTRFRLLDPVGKAEAASNGGTRANPGSAPSRA